MCQYECQEMGVIKYEISLLFEVKELTISCCQMLHPNFIDIETLFG